MTESQPRPRRSAFDDFDAFHRRWQNTEDRAGLVDEAVGLGERLVCETDATGQGTEFALVAALSHLATVTEVSGDPEDSLDAADALVSQMNALVNG